MYWKHLFKKTALLLAGLIVLAACGVKPTTMGYQHRIFMVVDSTLWQELGQQVQQGFERVIHTPHEEKTFYVIPIPLKELENRKMRMNVFFMALADEQGPAADYIKKSLPENFKKGAENGEYFYLFQQDFFARDQINLILYAKNKAAFKEQFQKNIDKIYKTFEAKYYARLKQGMFGKNEQEKLEDFLVKNYGWKLRLQHDYFIALQDMENKFVWIRRMKPDRWISIWEVKADSANFNLDSLVNRRNRMAASYYQGDVVEDEDRIFRRVDFNGQPAQKLDGLWRNDSLMVGGPFRLYAVYDPLESLYYMIDIAVMAPGKLKKPYLDQLEVIAHTFEVSDER